MASPVPTNYACINYGDGFEGIEISEINNALLMSLLEETQGEECDNERLISLIQSLEEEINPSLKGHETPMEPELASNIKDYQLCDVGQVDAHDCSASFDMDWITMEEASCSPSDDDMRITWYPYDDQMDDIIEFGGVKDFHEFGHGVSLEEHGSYLWQEQLDAAMYS